MRTISYSPKENRGKDSVVGFGECTFKKRTGETLGYKLFRTIDENGRGGRMLGTIEVDWKPGVCFSVCVCVSVCGLGWIWMRTCICTRLFICIQEPRHSCTPYLLK